MSACRRIAIPCMLGRSSSVFSSRLQDKSLLEEPNFNEFWEKDVAESVRQGDTKPFVEEAVLQVSDWGFNVADLQVQKQYEGKALLLWLKSLYSSAKCEWAGFLGLIHIWQGMDDRAVPPAMTGFVQRVVPGAIVHRLIGEATSRISVSVTSVIDRYFLPFLGFLKALSAALQRINHHLKNSLKQQHSITALSKNEKS